MYIGTPPQSGFISQEANQYFTGLTQNYIDLNQSISSLSSVIVLVNGVVQENSTMSLTSSTRITLGDTLVSADKVTCIYVAKISSTQAPAIGSVTSDMLSGSIANSKLATDPLNASNLASGTVPTARLGSGTASSSNFLRGDGSWQSAGGDNTPYFSGKKASDQTITRNTMTTVTGFTTTEIDSDSAFDGTTFTVPSGEAGVYFFSALVTSSFNTVGSDGERCLVTFMKNGSDSNMPNSDFTKASGYNIIKYTNTITAVLNLAVGDAITVAVYNKDGDASGNAYVNTNSNFMGYKLIT